MRYFRRLPSFVLAAALIGAGTYSPDDDGTKPPPGLQRTTMSLASLRADHAKADGRQQSHSFVEHWTVTSDGLTGTMVLTQRGNDDREDEVLANSLHTAEGWLGGREWSQNENGEMTYPTGIHRRTEIDAAAFAAGPDATLLGKLEQPSDYVVRVDPPDGRLEFVYVNASTFLIDRVDMAVDGGRTVITYEDYRKFSGAMVPGRVHTLITRTGVERDRMLQSIADVPSGDAPLTMPSPSTPLAEAHFPVTLPAQILSDRIIVTARLGGRTVNLQLDSGAAGVAIDRSVIDALQIPTIGSSTGTMAGNYSVSRAIVPELLLGGASFHNLTVDAIPFAQYADDRTVVAGLLGFDVLDTAVFKIDYVNDSVTMYDPASFTPPTGAYAQSIALDDWVPVLPITIGGATGKHFILDTGADRSTIYSAFRKAYPAAVVDQGLGTRLRDSFPFETHFLGVGGQVSYRPVQVNSLTVGGITLDNWLLDTTYDAASFEGEDEDGLIGQDVLRYFDVYLDYPHATIYFLPNSRYRDRFG